MNERTESAILDDLVARGLLSPDDLASAAPGARLEDLVARGLVHGETLADVMRGLEASSPSTGVATLPLRDASRQPEVPATAPTLSGRYVVESLLGRGAMGAVYRAYDPVLKRSVALKLLVGDDPSRAERFLREARAQARVSHEHVCKVFDAGVLDGKPFIAMQLVEGEPLQKSALEMTLGQKVKALAEVAEGVHAAHRLGLVHRDLKPANVMVERTADGGFHPYVLDFGLARDLDGPGLTATGQTVGTPAYMAPEQARGDDASMDRRMDVYGLGATLYHVLTGRPPFQGASALDVMLKVVDEEPPSLRSVSRAIPLDLETIALKCLEKDRDRRYDSAHALAEDLRRYLDGEPVLARPQSFVGRTLKRARKNRLAAAALLALVATLGLSGALFLRASRAARERTRLAQRFGAEVERIDVQLRIAHLLPLHDVSGDEALVARKLEEIETTMARVGEAATGPGRHALGKGRLALGQPEAARRELQAAWDAGYRPPEVAHVLARALLVLYERALDDARRVPSKELQKEQVAAAQRELRDPALVLLREGSGAVLESAAYTQGLLGYYEERYEDALARAEQASAAVPSLYEARLLAGDVHLAVGKGRDEKGDADGALASYARAGEAYLAAREIGRSDPLVYVADARRWLAVVESRGRRGQDPAEAAEEVEKAALLALRADPGDRQAPDLRARALFRRAIFAMQHGGDPAPFLSASAATAREALTRGSATAGLHFDVGAALAVGAEQGLARGLDTRAESKAAIAELEKAAALAPASATVLNGLGNAFVLGADAAAANGDDPLPLLESARRTYARLLERNPRLAFPTLNLGLVFERKARAEMEVGVDPGASFREAESAFRKVLEVDPKLRTAHNNLGHVLTLEAEHQAALGRDPREALGRAIVSLDTALALDPKFAFAWNNRGRAKTALAVAEADRGGDAAAPEEPAASSGGAGGGAPPPNLAPLLSAARADVLKAREINPGHFDLYLRLADLALVEARLGKRAALKEAAEAVDEAESRNPRSADVFLTKAEVALVKALAAPSPGARDVEAGLAAVESARRLRPRGVRARALEEALRTVSAKGEIAARPLFPWRRAEARLIGGASASRPPGGPASRP